MENPTQMPTLEVAELRGREPSIRQKEKEMGESLPTPKAETIASTIHCRKRFRWPGGHPEKPRVLPLGRDPLP